MISAEQYDQIEAYLFGQMDDTQRQAFEAELQQNGELAAELALHRLEHHSMQLTLENDFRQQMQGWHEEIKQEAPVIAPETRVVSIRRLSWRNLAVAASILLVLGFVGQRWVAANYGNTALLGDEDYASFVIRNGKVSSGVSAANGALASKNYQQVFSILDQIDTTNYDTEILRAGASYGLKDYRATARYLQSAAQYAAPLEKQELDWKLAMLYINVNDDEQAKVVLSKIIDDPNHDYHGDAISTLNKLNSFWRNVAW